MVQTGKIASEDSVSFQEEHRKVRYAAQTAK